MVFKIYEVFSWAQLLRSDPSVSSGVMVSKLDKQTFSSEFESYQVSHSYGLGPHLSKKLIELQVHSDLGVSGGVMVNK